MIKHQVLLLNPIWHLLLGIFVVIIITSCGSSSGGGVTYVSPSGSSSSSSSSSKPSSNESTNDTSSNSSSSNTTSIQQGVGSFSMASADTRSPSNIIQSAEYKIGGGAPSCDGGSSKQIVAGKDTYEIMPVSQTRTKAEAVLIASCGWNSTGSLNVDVSYPDGTSKRVTSTVFDTGSGLMAPLNLDLGNNPPLGNYRVTFKGNSGSVSHNFKLVEPTAPGLYTPSGSVILWNFRAGEPVLLFAYKNTGSGQEAQFAAYQQYMTDEHGELYVDVAGSFDAFVVLGNYTGEVSDFDWLKSLQSITR